ncbi:MAG: branched-chain amino acid ABC transporter ATP-binding protein/permease [Hyphomicrobiales bacterium]|nr:branched-chain amino acid ABC transporter ATP-binding protein/permease [Hyphomicrobiales bacterium]MDE2113696.1 branched-chain amino acid ABC transporter ATP-binding protein/permease [Hyphomicrobiales bacterium]
MNARKWIQAGFIVAVCIAPLLLPLYQVTVLNYIGLAALVALGLVLLTGIGGLTSFGQAAFVGMGAYTTAYLTTHYGLSPWITLVAGLVFTGGAALLIGLLTLSRLSGHYLPVSTIAWSISLVSMVGEIKSLGGHDGISNVPAIPLFQFQFDTPSRIYGLIWLSVGLGMLSVHNLLNSRNGRAIRALRAREGMAEAFGIHTGALKIKIFVHAALLACVSGWLFAHLLRFVSPTPFDFPQSIDYLFMTVTGGASSIWGALIGSATLALIKDQLQNLLPGLTGSGGAAEEVAFGLFMIAILHYARGGLASTFAGWLPARTPMTIAKDTLPLPTTARVDHTGPILQVEGAVKRFGGLVAVNEVSFELVRGEILGLIGPNGAGKSTMFNLLSGAAPLDSGKIYLGGSRIDGMASRQIARRGLARSFQHVQLISSMSLLENVALGAHLRSHAGSLASILRLERASESSLLAQAAHQIERVGLGAYMHAPAGTLALGQQRIAEIARALAADPQLLLLDEPAAGLRLQEKRQLADLLKQLRAEGLSVLIVEHDMEFVMGLVDRLVVMVFGQKLTQGLPADIRANPQVQEAYLGSVA